MKNLILVFCALCLGVTARAATFTLNNNNPSPGQYTTFAAAQTAASAGDTILVHGSPDSYLTMVVTKSLTIIGPGHKPKGAGLLNAKVGSIIIAANLSNIRISGLTITTQIANDANVSNVTIENCFFSINSNIAIDIAAGSNNWLIRNNIFNDAGSVPACIDLNDANQSGIIITNNYFSAPGVLIGFSGANPKLVTNNIFAWSGAGNAFNGNVNNTIFENNIFIGSNPNTGVQTNCVYNNNLTYLTTNNTLPPAGQSGSGNLVNVNPLFENAFTPPASSAFNYAGNYRLQAGSPAKGAGTGGTDLGIYEPDNVFSMTGEPARPQTTAVNVNPAVVPLNGSTLVNFTIRKSTADQ